MHRTGTSMVTRALHDCGLHLIAESDEELVDAAEDNPEGFWENKAIVACNDDLLEATGGAWDNPSEFPPRAVDDPRVVHLVDAATAAIASLREHEPWGFKDPRTCLTAGFWLDLCPDLRFVICVRNPLEVALSLKRRNQNSYSLGLRLWEQYYATVLDLVPPERRIVTHYDTFFVDPEGEIARLAEFAQLPAVPPRVRSELRHHTIGVSLAEAGVNENVRRLYAALCREAGVAQAPEPAADEAHVRRLILDGAVAARHAEQRQAAIDRLQQREEQFRAEHAEAEQALRARIRELEQQMLHERGRELHQTAARVEALRSMLDRRLTRVDARLAEIEPGPISKRVRRSIRRAEHGLVRFVLRPGKQAADQAAHKAAGRARQSVTKLPEPAQRNVRRTKRLVVKARREPIATAKRVARRLPPRAQAPLRKVWRRTARSRRTRSTTAPKVARPSPPKGPAFREWREPYQQLLARTLPDGAPWLVIAPGSPKDARGVRAPKGTPFPVASNGKPFADDLAHIAHVEALRFQGHRYLVLPEGSRAWFARQAELRDHVTRNYRSLVDAAGAGAVFDLNEPAGDDAASLLGVVTRLAAGCTDAPAVLNWTRHDVAHELPGLATFSAPDDARLPYLDHSVDIVVVDELRDVREARRVATLGVVAVAERPSGLDVKIIDANGSAPRAMPRVLVWSADPEHDPVWRAGLEERARAAGADVRFAPVDGALHDVDGYDVVLVLEPFVLPLPSTIELAANLVALHPGVAHAGKVLRADGKLEAAGGIVFANRSSALIGYGSDEVRGAWHEYARPVCWAPGLVAAAPSLLRSARVEARAEGREFLREWCAAVWERGASVRYEPSLPAVRVRGDGAEPAAPLPASAWQRVLDLRPARPAELGDGQWRHVLGHDDPEACRA